MSYDIADDRRRTRLAHSLKDFGHRVQYSVFECELDAAQVEKLEARIGGLIAEEEDSVRVYRLCGECRGKVRVHGLGKLSEEPQVYVL